MCSPPPLRCCWQAEPCPPPSTVSWAQKRSVGPRTDPSPACHLSHPPIVTSGTMGQAQHAARAMNRGVERCEAAQPHAADWPCLVQPGPSLAPLLAGCVHIASLKLLA